MAVIAASGLAIGRLALSSGLEAQAQSPSPTPSPFVTAEPPVTHLVSRTPTHSTTLPSPTHSTTSRTPTHSTTSTPSPSVVSPSPSQSSAPSTRPPAQPVRRCAGGVQIIYVGGYNDPSGGGWAALPLKDELRKNLLKVLPPVPVQVGYESLYDSPGRTGLKGVPSDEKATGEGRDNLVARLNVLSKTRPKDVCLALIGYSTGVVVIQRALSEGGVSTQLGSQIVSIEMFADPTKWPGVGNKYKVGSEYADRIKYECNSGDPLCDSGAVKYLPGPAMTQWLACQRLDYIECANIEAYYKEHLPPAYEKSEKAKSAAEWAARKAVPGAGLLSGRTKVVGADGDTLLDLARRYSGGGPPWEALYEANRAVIEKAARDHGFASSDNGHWIFPGTSLIIPPAA